jgi:hypothetical protein
MFFNGSWLLGGFRQFSFDVVPTCRTLDVSGAAVQNKGAFKAPITIGRVRTAAFTLAKLDLTTTLEVPNAY